MNKQTKGVIESSISGSLYGANSSFARKFSSTFNESKFAKYDSPANTLASTSLISGLRELVAFIFVLMIAVFYKKKYKMEFSPIKKFKQSKNVRFIAGIAIFGGAFGQLAYFLSLNYLSPSIVAIFVSTWIVFTTVLSTLILSRKYNKITWIGVLVVVGGQVITSVASIKASNGTTTDIIIGITLITLTAFFWGLQAVLTEKGLQHSKVQLSFIETNFFRYGVSATLLTIMTIVFVIMGYFSLDIIFTSLFTIALMWLLFAGSNAAITNVLLHSGVKNIGAVISSIIQNVSLVTALFWSLLITGEQITLLNVVSALVVFGGITIVTYGNNLITKK